MSFMRTSILLFIFLFQPVMAEDILPTISITASRTPIEVQHSSTTISIITAEQIAESKAVYVSELLQSVAGLNVSRTGGSGNITQLRMRGGEANHVLVLIDGIEANRLSSGSEFRFDKISTEQIERIEVLRGAQSSLWGSDALSGVINIITKRAKKGQEVTLSSSLGQRDYWRKGLSLGYGGDQFDIQLGADLVRTDGVNSIRLGNEKDGFNQKVLNLKSHYNFNNGAELGLVFHYKNSDGESDPSNSSDGYAEDDEKEYLSRVFYKWDSWQSRWQQQLAYSVVDQKNKNKQASARSTYDGKKHKWMYQSTFKLPVSTDRINRQSLTFAAERERDNYEQVTSSSSHKQRIVNYGYVAEYQLGFMDDFNFSASGRADDNDEFKNTKTYRLGLSYIYPDWGTKLHIAHATGVKNPTFTELFGWSPASFIGNPDLKAEHSKDWELGVSQEFFDEQMNLTVTLFQQRLKDEIASNKSYNGSINSDGESKRDGLELDLQGNLSGNIRYGFSYTYLVATEGVSGGDDKTEVRRPKHQWSGLLNYAFFEDKANLQLSADHIGKHRDVDWSGGSGSRVELDDYLLINMTINYAVASDLKLWGRVSNLFDEDYTEVSGYNDEGTTIYAGFEITL
jgi:vitamin B12 transporter